MKENVNLSDVFNKIIAGSLLTIATFVAHSISQLNEKVAIVVERLVFHEKRLDSAENQINRIISREEK